MIYKSNLTCPDLTPHFKHLHSRVMGHSFGHDVPSDWADKADDDPVFGIYKRCGFWTHDEAAILYNVARSIRGRWLDIGAHTGWTGAYIIAAGGIVTLVDPMLRLQGFQLRLEDNLSTSWDGVREVAHMTSEYFFHGFDETWKGIVIDGDHEPGKPLEDAQNAAKHLAPGGVIMFHDFVGLPVREAVRYLMDEDGMSCRLYLTPHVVALCWIGSDFQPPVHRPDPFIVSQDLPARWPEFDWRPFISPAP